MASTSDLSRRTTGATIVALVLALVVAPAAVAAPPVVKTVPAVATNPLIPHDIWSGKAIRLKGTADRDGAGITYEWDPGDGNPVYTGNVTNRYVIEATHTYTGAVGTVFTAKLTVTDTNTAESAFQVFRVEIKPQELPVEVNYAIGEGLWYLQKTMVRTTLPDSTQAGHWRGAGEASHAYFSTSAANILAFEVSGHLETGNDATNPYVETVTRGLKDLFNNIVTTPIPNSQTNGVGTFNPDGNGNGYGVQINQTEPFYQGGMMMDAIIATGTPNAVTTNGEVPSAPDPGIKGRTYADIIQDMADFYSYCQYDSPGGGGWRYSCNSFPDTSANQWGAIGLIPAERDFGSSVSQVLKDWNLMWLNTAQGANGSCGYTSTGPAWGPYGTTPACMVQLVLSGVGRGDARWDKAETFMRDNFGNAGNSNQAPKSYYYGLFSFTKSMLLHDSNGDEVAEPITMLQSSTPGVPPIDWYAAEVSKGDPTNGVARTLVNDQNPAGYWTQHSVNTSDHWRFETGWAITMLRRTVSQRQPIAVVTAVPNPGVVNQQITFDCSDSFHTDPARQIVKWEWDLDNDGDFDDATGPIAMRSFDALGDYPVKCKVTDGGDENGEHTLSDDATVIANISIPPIAPTAEAGGPYLFCLGKTPWFLDGTASVNPDDGIGEPGAPGDSIKEYAWDFDGNATTDALGAQPDVTAAFTALGVGDYVISLKVTDNTSLSAPSSGLGDLSDTDSAEVRVRAADDPQCASCQLTLSASGGPNGVNLSWSNAGAAGYNVYRSALQGGPYVKIGSTTATSFSDGTAQVGVLYYYVVRETLANGDEVCQSNEAQGTRTSEQVVSCAFAVRTKGRLNNDARIEGNFTANDPEGLVRIGRRARMSDGTLMAGDKVSIGNFASAFNVSGNQIAVHARGANIRGTRTDGLMLPLAETFCPLAEFSCGGQSVVVDRRGLGGPLSPGSYDTIQVKNDAKLELAPGVYNICNLIVARKAKIVLSGGTQTVLNVLHDAKFANGTMMVPPEGTPTPALNVLGGDMRLGPLSKVQAFITAPNALIRIGKQAELRGSFCADHGRAGHSIHLACAPGAAPPTTTTTTTSTTTTTEEPTTTTTTVEDTTTTTSEDTTTTTTTTVEDTTTTTTVGSPDGGFIQD